MNIVLASSSPRRKRLLKMLGIKFSCIPPQIDEKKLRNENASALVERLAMQKAKKIASKLNNKNTIIMAGDLVVEFEKRIIGKPKNFNNASNTLLEFSGKTHLIRDGFCVMQGEQVVLKGVSTSIIEFKKINKKIVTKYLKQINWNDKAGSYAIQDSRGNYKKLIKKITGSLYSVIGIPLKILAPCLQSLDVNISKENIFKIYENEKTILKNYNNLK